MFLFGGVVGLLVGTFSFGAVCLSLGWRGVVGALLGLARVFVVVFFFFFCGG